MVQKNVVHICVFILFLNYDVCLDAGVCYQTHLEELTRYWYYIIFATNVSRSELGCFVRKCCDLKKLQNIFGVFSLNSCFRIPYLCLSITIFLEWVIRIGA